MCIYIYIYIYIYIHAHAQTPLISQFKTIIKSKLKEDFIYKLFLCITVSNISDEMRIPHEIDSNAKKVFVYKILF